MAQYISEQRTSEIRDIIETMVNLHPPAFELVRQTSETMLHLAQMGYSVIVGRGGNIVTRKLPGGFHVRLIGSAKKRVSHLADYFNQSTADAEKMMRTEDKGRADYLKQNFDKNIDDPLLYDLVINTDSVSYEDAAQMIGDQVLRKQIAVNSQA